MTVRHGTVSTALAPLNRTIARLLGIVAFALMLFVGVMINDAAAAEALCAPRADILEVLNDSHDEAPRAIGLASNGGVVEVLTTVTGSTWTIIVTLPNGMSCMIAAGESWMDAAPQLAGQIS